MAWKAAFVPNSYPLCLKWPISKRVRERNGLRQGYLSLTQNREDGCGKEEGGKGEGCEKGGYENRGCEKEGGGEKKEGEGGRERLPRLTAWLRYDI